MADANTAAIAGGSVAAKLPVTYSIRLVKLGSDRLKLRGLVASKEDHKALLGLVKASFPSVDVSDRIKVADGPKSDMKLGGISFALKALSHLQSGSARIDEHGVALAGETESPAVYKEVRALIDAGRPTGLVVEDNIALPRTAFFWRAEVDAGKIKFSGAVPDDADKKRLEAAAQKLFSGVQVQIVDTTSIEEGAPESWLEAAIHSLRVLRLLNSGVVQVTDHSIQVEGHTSDEAMLREIDILADEYPAGFALESTVSVPPMQASMFGLQLPYAAAAARLRSIDGETPVVGAEIATGATPALGSSAAQ